MISPRVEPDITFPLRRNALGYRFRAPKSDLRHWIQLLTGLMAAFALILFAVI